MSSHFAITWRLIKTRIVQFLSSPVPLLFSVQICICRSCVHETTSWCMSSYSTHYWCRACRKLATRNCLATSPRDTEVGLMASLLFCPFSWQQQPFCSLTGTISCGIAAVETKAVWLDGYHTPSIPFRHLPWRKDVLNQCLEFGWLRQKSARDPAWLQVRSIGYPPPQGSGQSAYNDCLKSSPVRDHPLVWPRVFFSILPYSTQHFEDWQFRGERSASNKTTTNNWKTGAEGLVSEAKTAWTGRMPESWPWQSPLAGYSSRRLCRGKTIWGNQFCSMEQGMKEDSHVHRCWLCRTVICLRSEEWGSGFCPETPH